MPYAVFDIQLDSVIASDYAGGYSHAHASQVHREEGHHVVELSPYMAAEGLREHVPQEILAEVRNRVFDATVGTDREGEPPLETIQRNGIPDLFVYSRGANGGYEFCFVEVKKPNGSLSKSQIVWMRDFPTLPTQVGFAMY